MHIISIKSHLIITNTLFLLVVYSVISTTTLEIYQNVVQCSTNYETVANLEFRFQCTVRLIFDERKILYQPMCNQFNSSALVVAAASPLDHISIVCTSNYAISARVEFSDGIVVNPFLNIKWNRTFVNFTDFSTYSYNVNVFPPSFTSNMAKDEAVKYIFNSVQHPSEVITILWFLLTNYVEDPHSTHPVGSKFVFWMNDKREVVLQDDVLLIPCVSPYELKLIKHEHNQSVTLDIPSNMGNGYFLMNISIFNNIDVLGNYSCELLNFDVKFLNFTVILPPKASTEIYYETKEPQLKAIYLQPHSRFALTVRDEYGLRFHLKCNSFERNVTLTANHYSKNSNVPTPLAIKQSTKSLQNLTLFTAEITTPILEIDSYIKCLCTDADNNLLRHWNVARIARSNSSVYYNAQKRNLECKVSLGLYDPVVHQMECTNPLLCKINGKQVQQINRVPETIGQCVSADGRQLMLCAALKAYDKGIIECRTDTKTISRDALFYQQQIYFIGFDRQYYPWLETETEPKKDAIMKVENLGKNPQMICDGHPAKYVIRCEAHSFYFEEGLHWFFEFENASQHQIHKDILIENNIMDKRERNMNPYSSVEITISDTKIKKIVCAAPRLSIVKAINYRLWEFESVNIDVLDAIKPTIVLNNSKTEYYFKVGAINPGITCYVAGSPTPLITWTTQYAEELTGDFIISQSFYKILRFPIYNSSFEGVYICTASNIAGNISKAFKVFTDYSSDMILEPWHIGLISTGFAALLIASILTIIFYRAQTKKKHLEEIIEIKALLNGPSSYSVGIDDDENIRELYYDRQLELQKHSFCIDKCKILGSGEFGIVFKGNIAKTENEVAFKTVKCTENTSHIKSLVSELKLMVYIGKHANIVELLGAYTQEIEKGILYVAIEFCGLGSLKSYLRSNKGRFLNCPILQANHLGAEAKPITKNEKEESSRHTIKSLIKWCMEISNAMYYLYSIKVIHGDLAIRNILLTVDWDVKLTDFGLSRRMYNKTEYLKTGPDPLPWRWLALESLQSNIFTTKTDVWAFGITLWEIFSLGEIPYPGINVAENFVSQLEKGLRNQKPKYSTDELYKVMMACWHSESIHRPSFSSLKLLFQNALSDQGFQVNVEDLEMVLLEDQTNHYIDLVE